MGEGGRERRREGRKGEEERGEGGREWREENKDNLYDDLE